VPQPDTDTALRELALQISSNHEQTCRRHDEAKVVIDRVKTKVDSLDLAMRGDVKTPGTMERVRRLEEFAAEFKSMRRWVAVGVVGLFGTLGWQVIQWAIAQGAMQ